MNGIERGALLGVERQLRLGQQRTMALTGGVAAHLDPGQALVEEDVEAVLVQLQLGEQLVGHPVGVLRQGRQGLALTRRASQARVVEAGAGGDVPETLLAGLGRFALAQQYR
ncbi:hypothetical protein D9M69_692530 [compost metagenome]